MPGLAPRTGRQPSAVSAGGGAAWILDVCGIGGIAGVDGGEKAGPRLVSDGDDDAAVANVECGEIVEITDERGKRLPAQAVAERKAIAEAEFVLGVDAGLRGVCVNVGAGLRDVGFRGQAQKKIGEGVARKNTLVKG